MSQRMTIDSIPFAHQKSFLKGDLDLSALSRLAREVVSIEEGSIHFLLRGDCGSKDEPLLVLELQGKLVLNCQRCLQPMTLKLDVHTAFELRDGLADHELLQEDLEDDSRDYLSASRSLDVIALIEDEALLSLPLVPRHAACGSIDVPHILETASQFGVLLELKGLSGKAH